MVLKNTKKVFQIDIVLFLRGLIKRIWMKNYNLDKFDIQRKIDKLDNIFLRKITRKTKNCQKIKKILIARLYLLEIGLWAKNFEIDFSRR